jgi:hypothetical protein
VYQFGVGEWLVWYTFYILEYSFNRTHCSVPCISQFLRWILD